jgi:intracellular sulfur oxidation DsrE/DsrF family protein
MKKILLAATAVLLTASFVVAVEKSKPFFQFPKIAGHGKVVHLPKAAEQPRDGSKICVDVTAGGPADEVNPALEKVARFVNIYAGAGKEPAGCSITVVLHGDATAAALSDAAYTTYTDAGANPSLPLIRQLREADVEFFVCGQAMASKGYAADDAADDVKVAVSALTVNVNRQMDGYAYIPVH